MRSKSALPLRTLKLRCIWHKRLEVTVDELFSLSLAAPNSPESVTAEVLVSQRLLRVSRYESAKSAPSG